MTELTNLYGVSKTLRFELKPIGKTLEHIEKNGLIVEDEQRAIEYKQAKEVINRNHKKFIDEALENVEIDLGDLNTYKQLLENRDDLGDIQAKLRKSIVKALSEHPKRKTLFKKELITKELPQFLEEEIKEAKSDEEKQKLQEEKEIISHFKKFTTYFSGFHENRKHMYSDEAKHGTIAYRIVHENLPIFISNIKLFDKINQNYPDIIEQTQESISEDDGIFGGAVVRDMFRLDYFTKTLSQIHIDLYYAMIGGITTENEKIQGFNEKINLYRQQHGLTKRDLPNFKPLYKQILSDRASLSWLPDAFENAEEVVEAIEQFYDDTIKAFKCCDGEVNLLSTFVDLFKETENYDKNFIYIKNDVALSDLSQAKFKYYDHIKEALWEYKLANNKRVARSKNLEKKRDDFFKQKFFSFAQIESAVDELDLFTFYKDKISEWKDKIETAYEVWQYDKENTAKTKDLLDVLLDLYRLFKGLKIDDVEKDLAFYSYFDTYMDALSAIQPLYNKVRNFKTKKPYSQEKFKFTIGKSNLLNGFVESKTDKSYNGTQYGGYLFRKKRNDGSYNYYLGISSKANLFSFYGEELSSEDVCEFERLHYYQVKTNSIYGSSYDGDFSQDKEILSEEELIKKLQNVLKIKYQHVKSLREIANRSYPSLKLLQDDIEIAVQEKSFIYKPVSQSEMDQVLSEGSMLLFWIYNKDFSEEKKNKNSRDNLHTMYFKGLMCENSDNDVFDLGKGEIFFRRKSISYDDDIWENGHHHKDLKNNFEYPIIKDRRYAVDKFLLHLSIFINYKKSNNMNINSNVNDFISKQSDKIKIIGIDRGERHLLYLSLIDAKGNIIEQYSLNQIVNSYNGKEFHIDYHEKLTEKEKKRDEERKSWKSIEKIKELKEGYLSQVIHKIATLILEHQAIVVLEDLNFGFKRGRFKVEKQVYQKFEKMLIDKLNYLVDKKREWSESAGVLNALQLTNKFTSFEKLGKQSGILFYVPAWNTSKMDPVTGFVNLFNTKYQSVEKSREFFSKFRSIRYNEDKGYYEFEFDYNDFHDRAQGTKSQWTVCSYGKRIVNFRNKEKNNQWDWKEIDPTQDLKELFGSYKGDLKEFIVAQDKKEFFERLLRIFGRILQMRNSATGTDIDYMLSPVSDENGNFFDSRKSDGSLPLDADANGAYNIARKGLMLVEKIKNADDKSKVKLTVTNKEWMAFAQGV